MDTQDNPQDPNLQFTDSVVEIIRTYLGSTGFTDNKITDTPTDALQVTNKKYVDSKQVLNTSVLASANSGLTLALTSAETQAIGDVVQINSSGLAHLAKADAIANSSGVFISTQAVTGSVANSYLAFGIIRMSSSPAWTKGGLVYLSATGTTGNTLTQTAPSGANNVIQILGLALAADTLFFNPCLVQVEHT